MQWTYTPRHSWSTWVPLKIRPRHLLTIPSAFLQQPQHQALPSRRGHPTAARCAALRWALRGWRRATGHGEPSATGGGWARKAPGRSDGNVFPVSGKRWVRNLHITIKRISATNVKILICGMGLHFWLSEICSEGHYYQLCWWQGTHVSTLAIFWDMFAAEVFSSPAQPLLAAQTPGAWYETRLSRVTDLKFSF